MKYFITYLLIIFCSLVYSQENDNLNSSNEIEDDVTHLQMHYLELSQKYFRNNYDSSMYYAEKAYEQSVLNEDIRTEGLALKRMGLLVFSDGNFNKADSFFKISSDNFIKTKDTLNYALILSCYGDLFKAKGETQKASEVYIKSQALLHIVKDKSTEALVLNKIAGLYNSLKQYDKAISYYTKALDIVSADNFLPAISALCINIGTAYSNKFEEEDDTLIKSEYLRIADSYYQKALPIKREINDLRGLSSCLLNIGLNNTRKKKYETAIHNFKETIEISKEINYSVNLFKAYQNLAHTYVNTGDYKKAKIYAEYVYNAEKSSGFESDIHMKYKNHYLLADIYKNLNIPNKALFHYTKYIDLKDSIYDIEKLKIINELDTKYQTTIKEQENKLLQKANDIQKLEIKRSRIQLLILFPISAVALLTLVVILLVIRQRKLKNQQKTIQLEQRLLRSQMNPHFIFNSLIAIQSFILKSEAEEGAKYLSKFATLIRLVLLHSRTEYVPVEKEIEALKLYLDLQKLRYENRFEFEIHEDESILFDNYLIPPMLAQPFIENAIEHGIAPTDKKGFIKVDFKRMGNSLFEFKVEDNGGGFSKNKNDNNHISLARLITEERLIMLNKNKRKKIKLEIKERRNSQNEVEGVTTFFYIPFINKY